MCGILGYFSASARGAGAESQAEFRKRLESIAHRGPDGRQCFFSDGGHVALGHARLSIIDLTDNNNQPFWRDEVGICFNGEIFNFLTLKKELADLGWKFHTDGDSEVLVVGFLQWGPKIFEKIMGMYAISIYVPKDDTLFLARDVFGIKPLYVREIGECIHFSSEIKALPGPKEVSDDGISDLMTFGYHFGTGTFFSDVTCVNPGEVLRFERDGSTLRRRRHQAKSFESIVAETAAPRSLRKCVEGSVEDHLLADTPVAVALSGGLDSSVVTAIAHEKQQDIRAFTNTFFAEGDAETDHAKILAEKNALNLKILHSDFTDLESVIKDIVYYLEEPLVNMALFNSYFLARATRDEGYKVILVGEGSDEIFAGYPWHALALTETDRLQRLELLRQKRAIVQDPPAYVTQSGRATMLARIEAQKEAYLKDMSEEVGSELNRFLAFDLKHQLVGPQLQRVDRMFMAFGVEARVPFLYDTVLARSFRSRSSSRLDIGEGWLDKMSRRVRYTPRADKLSLARAFKDLLPHEILSRPKFGQKGTVNVGQTPPMQQWTNVFTKVVEADEYRDARERLSPWIDWASIVPKKVKRREQVFLTMLAMSVGFMRQA